MDKDKDSMTDIICGMTYSMLPMVLNFFLNHASSYTNIYIMGMPISIKGCITINNYSARSVLATSSPIPWSTTLSSI